MIENFLFMQSRFPWFFPLLVGILGSLVGSFINVVVHRVPKGESVVFPGSHCACGKPIAWYDNIPIFSWFFLRGHARCCHTPFSFRYPFVEMVGCGLFLANYFLLTPVFALAGCIFSSFLLAGALIDFAHFELPDFSTVFLALVGILLAGIFPQLHGQMPTTWGRTLAVVDGLVGLFVASGGLVWFIIVCESVLKREVMGFGDVKLLGAVGVFCGWKGAILTLFFGAIVGVIWVLSGLVYRWLTFSEMPGALPAEVAEGEPAPVANFRTLVPFGPMLSIAAVAVFLMQNPDWGFGPLWRLFLLRG